MAKRYYKKLREFPEGIDHLEAEVRLPIDEEQIEVLLETYFLGGNMKPTVGYLILKYGLWEEAMNIGRHGKPRIAFRATWVLEWAYEQSSPDELPEWFADRMADDFAASSNGSLHRVYAKMLCDQMRFGDFSPTGAQAEKLAEKCFDLVIDPKTKTAVTFWCLEVLSELAPRVDWVAGELEETVRRISESPGCTPGIAVACREILKRLK